MVTQFQSVYHQICTYFSSLCSMFITFGPYFLVSEKTYGLGLWVWKEKMFFESPGFQESDFFTIRFYREVPPAGSSHFPKPVFARVFLGVCGLPYLGVCEAWVVLCPGYPFSGVWFFHKPLSFMVRSVLLVALVSRNLYLPESFFSVCGLPCLGAQNLSFQKALFRCRVEEQWAESWVWCQEPCRARRHARVKNSQSTKLGEKVYQLRSTVLISKVPNQQ